MLVQVRFDNARQSRGASFNQSIVQRVLSEFVASLFNRMSRSLVRSHEHDGKLQLLVGCQVTRDTFGCQKDSAPAQLNNGDIPLSLSLLYLTQPIRRHPQAKELHEPTTVKQRRLEDRWVKVLDARTHSSRVGVAINAKKRMQPVGHMFEKPPVPLVFADRTSVWLWHLIALSRPCASAPHRPSVAARSGPTLTIRIGTSSSCSIRLTYCFASMGSSSNRCAPEMFAFQPGSVS